MVVGLDQLGRSVLHVIQTIEELQQRGILIRSLGQRWSANIVKSTEGSKSSSRVSLTGRNRLNRSFERCRGFAATSIWRTSSQCPLCAGPE